MIFFQKISMSPKTVFYCHSKFHCIDLFSLPLWHGEYLHASRVALLSHCSLLSLNIKNFSPEVSITAVLEARLSLTQTVTNAEIQKFDILTTLKLYTSCHSNHHSRNGIILKSNLFIYLVCFWNYKLA